MVSTRSENRKLIRMYHVILRHGEIHRWDLKDAAGLSIRDIHQLSSYFRHKYVNEISYDKETETYMLIDPIKRREAIEALVTISKA